MNKQKRNLLGIAGIVSTVLGIIFAIPSFLQELYALAVVSSLLIVTGLVLLAISFGD